ncbi:hypothetical protein BJ742DRAFT_797220 [Cladochytrium replicatum]|nr:hypothetical protein BJ742DRAFT_797220 [Cladochytrium replicatum]
MASKNHPWGRLNSDPDYPNDRRISELPPAYSTNPMRLEQSREQQVPIPTIPTTIRTQTSYTARLGFSAGKPTSEVDIKPGDVVFVDSVSPDRPGWVLGFNISSEGSTPKGAPKLFPWASIAGIQDTTTSAPFGQSASPARADKKVETAILAVNLNQKYQDQLVAQLPLSSGTSSTGTVYNSGPSTSSSRSDVNTPRSTVTDNSDILSTSPRTLREQVLRAARSIEELSATPSVIRTQRARQRSENETVLQKIPEGSNYSRSYRSDGEITESPRSTAPAPIRTSGVRQRRSDERVRSQVSQFGASVEYSPHDSPLRRSDDRGVGSELPAPGRSFDRASGGGEMIRSRSNEQMGLSAESFGASALAPYGAPYSQRLRFAEQQDSPISNTGTVDSRYQLLSANPYSDYPEPPRTVPPAKVPTSAVSGRHPYPPPQNPAPNARSDGKPFKKTICGISRLLFTTIVVVAIVLVLAGITAGLLLVTGTNAAGAPSNTGSPAPSGSPSFPSPTSIPTALPSSCVATIPEQFLCLGAVLYRCVNFAWVQTNGCADILTQLVNNTGFTYPTSCVAGISPILLTNPQYKALGSGFVNICPCQPPASARCDNGHMFRCTADARFVFNACNKASQSCTLTGKQGANAAKCLNDPDDDG